jgi:general stress protein 26
MTRQELLARLSEILEEAGTGLLATVDAEGRPRMRWMTPALLAGRPGALFALTSPRFAKAAQISGQPRVEWMFQSPSLKEIITLRGQVNLLDNPSIRSEVLEKVGPRLRAFWKLNADERDLLVLETVLQEGSRYLPLTGEKASVRLDQG